ncbi:MAG: hypothetical protein WAM61_03940 [Desulfobacterales bacterium]
MGKDFLQIGNGEAVGRDCLPHLTFADFRQRALDIVAGGGKIVHYFAYADDGAVKLLAVLRSD